MGFELLRRLLVGEVHQRKAHESSRAMSEALALSLCLNVDVRRLWGAQLLHLAHQLLELRLDAGHGDGAHRLR